MKQKILIFTLLYLAIVGFSYAQPANDDCSGAFPVTVNPDDLCGSTTAGTVLGATASSQSSAACPGDELNDVWFSFTATNTVQSIDLINITGSPTDLSHSVWTGTCPGLTVKSCFSGNSSVDGSYVVGQTYFIRVSNYTFNSGSSNDASFDVCVGEIPPCVNPANNDYCSDPATLTQGAGTWTASTAATYTADQPANVITPFCGSIENNSWYQFTATSTTETFNFTSVTGCAGGIQAQVYDVLKDANGCCLNFTSVSNCWNPGTATTGTVTATPLVVGQTYILMVDGQAGANCDFTVSGWTATGILPVTLLNFDGYNYQNGNKLFWTTKTEINNDYFIVQKSSNAQFFIDAGIVDGNGNSNNAINYDFIDDSPFNNITYYRLKQIDFDGKYDYSNIIAIETKSEFNVTIYPNPSKNNLFIDISDTKDEVYTVKYINVLGSIFEEKININEGTNTYQVNKFSELNAGVYFIQIYNGNNELLKTKKIIKQE